MALISQTDNFIVETPEVPLTRSDGGHITILTGSGKYTLQNWTEAS